MSTNKKQMYEHLIRYGLLKMRKGKLVLKRKGPVSKQQLFRDPRFENCRRNMTDFKICMKAGQLLRRSLTGFGECDNQLYQRLHSLFNKILKSDTDYQKGTRSIMRGDFTLLKGFQFNRKSDLTNVDILLSSAEIDSKKGKAVLDVPFINPALFQFWPDSVDAVEISSILISINFDEGTCEESKATSKKIFRKEKKPSPFKLITQVKETENRILIHCVAVRFFHPEVNGYACQYRNSNFNPAGVVGVERGK